jgi:formamidopyrimidine-DNA glycosylase
MPELPEVELIAQALREPLTGRRIVNFTSRWPSHLIDHEADEMGYHLVGRLFRSIHRRGKYLVFTLDGGYYLIIHLKMTGQLLLTPSAEAADKHDHTVFALDNGRDLRFRDVRKFGRVRLVRDPADVLGSLGPEPLSPSFMAEWLFENLRQRKRLLKPLLLDQTFIAGIGNIYADEALHHARIRPGRISNTLSADESKALYDGIRLALTIGLKRGGATIENYRRPDGSTGEMQEVFVAYGRTGQPCLRCGGTIERVVLGGRSTHFCNSCQV